MAIIKTGSEDIDFNDISPGFKVSTFSSHFDNRLARSAVAPPSSGTEMALEWDGTEYTEGWIHFEYFVALHGANQTVMGFYDTASGKYIAGLWVTTSSSFGLMLDNALIVAPGTLTLSTNTKYKIDIQYVRNATTGTVKLYVDDSLRLSFTGDTTVTGSTGFDQVRMRRTTVIVSYYSQVIFDNSTATLGRFLHTGFPNLAGNYTAWSGAFTDIDEAVIDSNDFIFTNSLNQLFTFGTANIHNDFSSYNVDAVQLSTLDRISSSSTVNDLQHVVRSASVDHTTGNLGITKDNSLHKNHSVFLVDPTTSTAWDKATYDAAEFGVKSV